jgi:hypothetical protein
MIRFFTAQADNTGTYTNNTNGFVLLLTGGWAYAYIHNPDGTQQLIGPRLVTANDTPIFNIIVPPGCSVGGGSFYGTCRAIQADTLEELRGFGGV